MSQEKSIFLPNSERCLRHYFANAPLPMHSQFRLVFCRGGGPMVIRALKLQPQGRECEYRWCHFRFVLLDMEDLRTCQWTRLLEKTSPLRVVPAGSASSFFFSCVDQNLGVLFDVPKIRCPVKIHKRNITLIEYATASRSRTGARVTSCDLLHCAEILERNLFATPLASRNSFATRHRDIQWAVHWTSGYTVLNLLELPHLHHELSGVCSGHSAALTRCKQSDGKQGRRTSTKHVRENYAYFILHFDQSNLLWNAVYQQLKRMNNNIYCRS